MSYPSEMSSSCGVYVIRNLVTGFVYVGQSTNVPARWRQHRSDLGLNKHQNRHLQAAWNKHGENSFSFQMVWTCLPEQLGEAEVYELSRHVLVYNNGPAGDNPTRGVRKTLEHRLKLSRAYGGKPFFAIAPDGSRTRFEHAGVLPPGFEPNAVYSRLKGRSKNPYNGFWWQYDESFVPEPKIQKQTKPKEKRNREIVGTCIATGETRTYPFVAKVTADGFQRTNVTRCLSGELMQAGGWRWRYADGLPHRTMSEDKKQKLRGPDKNSRAVMGVNEQTGETVELAYIAQAKQLGIDPAMIHHCLNGAVRTAGGFRWYEKKNPTVR